MEDIGSSPAWMICDDVLTRVKDELILEAIDILHDEINAHRLIIEGYNPVMLDRSIEMERDMYLIKNLTERSEEISKNYSKYFTGEQTADWADPERLEELKKFLMSVSGIRILMEMADVFEGWSSDTGRYYKETDPKQIIAKTMGKGSDREKALEYVLKSKKFTENEAVSADELDMLRKGMEMGLNQG